MLNSVCANMFTLNKLRKCETANTAKGESNFAQIGIIPHENPHTPLKAETTAAGETLQRLGGGGGEKSKRL